MYAPFTYFETVQAMQSAERERHLQQMQFERLLRAARPERRISALLGRARNTLNRLFHDTSPVRPALDVH